LLVLFSAEAKARKAALISYAIDMIDLYLEYGTKMPSIIVSANMIKV
jgi:hypothetical protein